MKVVLATLLAYGLALLGLALGRLFGRPGLRGTCGRGCGGCDACEEEEKEEP